MLLHQYYLECLAQASYLVGDRASGVAAVVDPRRDVDVYIDAASAEGLQIQHVFLTHFHADFASGHLELRDRCGAEIHIGRGAETEYAFTPSADGDSWTFGDVRVEVMATPGHTPESISLLVFDLTKTGDAPHAVLTGDCLFIGDVGRPDLMASAGLTQEEMATQLYRSTRDRLLTLPDDTLIYPGHGAGSMCGKSLGAETVSTIGEQRRSNPALQPMSCEAFVALVCEGQQTVPPYFSYDAEFNKRDHAIMGTVISAIPSISVEQALDRQRQGAVILDTRDSEAYCAGHIPGSINVGLDGRFVTWVGTILSHDTELVIGAPEGRGEEAARRLGRIGFDRVVGCIDGFDAAVAESQSIALDRITPDAMHQALREAPPGVLVDVRQPNEWEASRIAGSVNIPLTRFVEDLHRLPAEGPLHLHCQSGYRSAVAASLLARHGRTGFADLKGGLDAWIEAGHPVIGDPERCS